MIKYLNCLVSLLNRIRTGGKKDAGPGVNKRAELGREGESIAENFLKQNRYKILEKNFRTKFGELDIIAKDKKCVVFVEVKTRKDDSFGAPQSAVTGFKQENLALAAMVYIKKKVLRSDYRFDIIAIQDGKIEHIKNAFAPSGFTV